MIAVIFEVEPAEGHLQPYLDIASGLRPILETIPGFISVERFQSLTNKGKYLSLSFWEDEAAVARWRNRTEHREAQAAGRAEHFAGYRLRIASVVRDYAMHERRDQAPPDSPF